MSEFEDTVHKMEVDFAVSDIKMYDGFVKSGRKSIKRIKQIRWLYFAMAATFAVLGTWNLFIGKPWWLWGIQYGVTGIQGFNYWLNQKTYRMREESVSHWDEKLKAAYIKLKNLDASHLMLREIINEEPEPEL